MEVIFFTFASHCIIFVKSSSSYDWMQIYLRNFVALLTINFYDIMIILQVLHLKTKDA